MCYPKINVGELLKMKVHGNNYLFNKLPLILIKQEYYSNYKEFYLSLSDNSPSAIKEILIRIYSNDEMIVISCIDFIGVYFGELIKLSSFIKDGIINRINYDNNCKKIRNIVSPLQNGKEMLKSLLFLAWISNQCQVSRTDDSKIPGCIAPYIMIRLALNKDALGVEEGFEIKSSEELNTYNEIKEILRNDSELVNLCKKFEKNRDAQEEICIKIHNLIYEKYYDYIYHLRAIHFVKDITDLDAVRWIKTWEPNISI